MTNNPAKPAAALGWNFPLLNDGDIKGFHDAVQEYFQGNHAQVVAREVIQNSLDARKKDGRPVEVHFERFTAPAASLPGLQQLPEIFSQAKSFAADQAGAGEFYDAAMKLLKKDKLPVLRISDFNTIGISGQDREHSKPWCQLTRSVGISTKMGGQGGTFGIGKGAPFVASKLRTVYYLTLNGERETIFMGKCRISSYEDQSSSLHDGVGNFGASADGCVQSIRDEKLIPGIFKKRTETGTDIYIAAYDSRENNWQHEMVVSVLENFWAAIYFEDLVVKFIDGSAETVIKKSNLEDALQKYNGHHTALPFFEAATSGKSFRKKGSLPSLGSVRLFIALADDFPKRIQMMRGSKMLIDYYAPKILRDGFAGVFICDSKEGNEMLRSLEPPAHDKWVAERQEYGKKVMKELYGWIKDCMKELSEKSGGKPDEIPDLNKYLPEAGQEDDEPIAAGDSKKNDDDRESGKLVGSEKEREQVKASYSAKRNVSIRKDSGGGPQPPAPPGPHKPQPGPKPPDGPGPEKGSHPRLDTSNIKFRSFAVPNDKGMDYQLVITSDKDQEGALKIIASGEDAEYDADLVTALGMDDKRSYETKQSFISGIRLKAGIPFRLKVSTSSKRRYILAIESHGS